jgi:hypothetical protein
VSSFVIGFLSALGAARRLRLEQEKIEPTDISAPNYKQLLGEQKEIRTNCKKYRGNITTGCQLIAFSFFAGACWTGYNLFKGRN